MATWSNLLWAGSSGGSSPGVVSADVDTGELRINQNAAIDLSITVGSDITGKVVKFVCCDMWTYVALWQATCTANGYYANLSVDDTNTATAGVFRYEVWNTTDDVVVGRGLLIIEDATSPT